MNEFHEFITSKKSVRQGYTNVLLYTIHKDDGVLVASAEIRVAFINSVRKVIAIPEYLVSIASRLSIS
jgi:hypothetical protein